MVRRIDWCGLCTMTGGGLFLLALLLSGCSGQTAQGKSANAAIQFPARQGTALGGTGITAQATGSFSAIQVDMGTWRGTPAGTGQFSAAFQPPLSGGPQAIAASSAPNNPMAQYLVIGDFQGGNTIALSIAADGPFTMGNMAIDGIHVYAVLYDILTGDILADAVSGTVSFTSVGTNLGDIVSGSLSATFELTTCTSNSQCPSGHVCQSGSCVPQTGGCSSNAQCPAGYVCQSGSCVPQPRGCSSNAQCPSGHVCQNGACIAQPTGCASRQGTGSFSVQFAPTSACSALRYGVTVSQGYAYLDSSTHNGGGFELAVVGVNGNSVDAAILLWMNACPAVPGTLSLGAGLEAAVYVATPMGPGFDVYARYQPISGSASFAWNGTDLTGNVTLGFANGGTASGSFTLQ